MFEHNGILMRFTWSNGHKFTAHKNYRGNKWGPAYHGFVRNLNTANQRICRNLAK